jgi:hypothetical protein
MGSQAHFSRCTSFSTPAPSTVSPFGTVRGGMESLGELDTLPARGPISRDQCPASGLSRTPALADQRHQWGEVFPKAGALLIAYIVNEECGPHRVPGGVVSPVIANIFMHLAFDTWMAECQPNVSFERYADDIVIHCGTAGPDLRSHRCRALHQRLAPPGRHRRQDPTARGKGRASWTIHGLL